MGMNFLRWQDRSENGNFAVPFSFHPGFPEWSRMVEKFVMSMNDDLGCVEFVKGKVKENLNQSLGKINVINLSKIIVVLFTTHFCSRSQN